MSQSKQKLNRLLSDKLHEIGQEPHDVATDDDGQVRAINKLEVLARSIWEYALGRTERLRSGEEKKHLPSQWAINVILDRTEGKVMPQPTPDKADSSVPISDKVSELGKNRLNDMVDN